MLTAQVVLLYLLQHHLHIRLLPFENDEITSSIFTIIVQLTACKLTFESSGQLVVGTSLLAFVARKYEREMGSVRFLNLFVFCNTLVVLFEFMGIGFWKHNYGGPYPTLGACLWLYIRYTPRLYPTFISVLGLSASEKVFYYLWFAQVLYQEGIRPAVLGAVACVLFMALQLQMPATLAKPIQSFLNSVQTPPKALIMLGIDPMAQQAAAVAAPVVAPRPPVQPDPAAIEQLVMMGFEQQQVIQALQATGNNIQRAADQLLSQVS